MNDSTNNNNIKRSQSKKRSKSYRESKNSLPSYEKESSDAKDMSLEVKSMKSTASTKKKHHHHHHHSISRKKTNKSEFSRSKQKKVSFKQNLAEVVHIENWKIYNTDISEDQINNIRNSGKDKTKCACVLC